MLDVHGVNFFNSSALSLDHEEIDDETADNVTSGKDISITEIDGGSDEWCEESDEELLRCLAQSMDAGLSSINHLHSTSSCWQSRER